MKTIIVHSVEFSVDLNKIFTKSDQKYALIHLRNDNSVCCYRPYEKYEDVCNAMNNYRGRVDGLLIIDTNGIPLHYAYNNGLKKEVK